MKKSVRIRKALPGEKPGYYNKTAKFLKKAQMGMEVNSPSNDPQRLNAIYTNVYASLMSDITPDVVYSSLISEYALDENTALMILRSALGKLAEEGKIDPESLEGGNSQQNQKQEEQPSETQDRESQEEYDQRMSEDAEQDELAMSDEGYYDEEEAANNDNSHLDTEEDEQQQGFRFGGYRQDGGESDEDYSDYYDDSSQSSSPEEAVINQYNNPGQNKMQKPFSIEDLIGMTPGIQGTQAVPGIEDYLGDYRPISESYGSMDYLPQAQNGLNLLPGFTRAVEQGIEAFNKGYSAIRSLTPMTNTSGIRKALPIATLTGEALTKLPYVGPKLTPQLKTTFTQNRNHLWEVLNGANPNQEIFGNVGTRANPDGSLQVNRLLLYQDDVAKIVNQLESAASPAAVIGPDGTVTWDYSKTAPERKVFHLGEVQPMAAADGLVSGVYPMDAKVTGGVDDEGNKFFEISHKFGPNQTLPFGSTSNKAKELTFKNRFYYKNVIDPATNQSSIKVFGPLGEELTPGIQTKFKIQRPFVPSVLRTEGETLLRDPNTPFPNFQVNFGRNPNGPFTSGVGRVDITSTPPSTVDRLGVRGKIGRGLENFALSTYVPQIFGLGNPLRTSPKNVSTLELPVLGYTSSALGPNVINPALETGVANDIANAMNYKYRIGRNALIGTGALGYLGYKTWDAFYNQCQCDNPTGRNYMPKDEYGNCPCGGDVGDKRMLDPTGQPIEQLAPQEQLTVPDSMKFLDEQGLYPTEQNYYRLKGKNKRSQAVDYKTGGITEKQFVKAFSSKFQDGGPQDQSLGKGKRMDTLTNDVEARKDIFKSKLKDNSNVALTKEIYKNAQSNPQILNMLMQDGPKENLAEDTGMQTAQFGGVPSWYTGYNTALSPKEYRKLYRQMKRMIPRGLDISRANMASNFYDKRFMQPGYGAVVSTPEYMNMLAISSLPMYKSAANVYGGGRKPSELQADEATAINNEKGIPLLPEMTPDFIDSPLVGNPEDVEYYWRNKRAPILGETYDTWYTSDGSTPGFAPDTRTWDGTQWVGPSPSERMQLENREQGGFVDMDAENPLVRFIYGGDETGYYEPEDLPMAQFGQNIMNKDLEQRVVGDKLSYDDWVEGERDDFATTHPGEDFDTWKAGQAGKDDYKKYEDFYGKSLYDYTNFDDPNVNPNSNNTNNNTQNGKNCPQGYVWNATYNACIPVAQVTYNPRVVRGQSGLFRNLAPWNPAFGYAGSWTKQMSLPYQLGSRNPYMGQLTGAPAARYVTKKGIFGKPKKWIDIYDVDGSGEAINPLEIEQLVGQQGRGSGRMKAPKGPSRRDMLQQYAQNQYGFTDDEWQDETRSSRRDMMRSVRQDMRADRRQDKRDNRERRFPRARAIDADRNPTGRGRQALRNVLSRSLPFGAFLQPKEYGGDLNEYGPGGINDPSEGNVSVSPSAFSMYGYDPISTAPQSSEVQNLNAPAAGFRDTTGLNNAMFQKTNKRNLVGVENKRKDMFNVDPESFLNQTNAFARGALNLFDPEKKRQCGPGTTWNSSTQTCQPTDAMDIYATATEQDRGDWVDIGSKAGLYRYDQEGQDRSSRATFGQYGGYMQDGGFYDPYYEEDEEVIMTPEELEQFLAAGGQVEYL
jgi:hypothetical protein